MAFRSIFGLCSILMQVSILVLSLCFSALAVQAAESATPLTPAKYALVIGNGNYSSSKNSLKNPVSDAKLLSQSLVKLGFEVRSLYDLDKARMTAAVADFSNSLPVGSTSLVFFAGHGMQIEGSSYLLPVDMAVTSEKSVPVRAYPLKELLERVSLSKSSVNVVILDACRDNPFQPSPSVRYRGFRDLGLGPVVAPRGTFVAYSTSPGQLAADGKEINSVYTATLARAILEPKVSLENIFKKVGDQVRKKTLDDQIPWFESSISDDYYFLPPDGVKVVGGQSLQVADASKTRSTGSRQFASPLGPDVDPVWYRSMNDYEWSKLDFDIQQRVKNMTKQDQPMMEHRAKGGSVVAQTTLGLYWREGTSRITESGTGKVSRYQADNVKAVQWLRMAAKAGFPIAQAELGEMLYRGKGIDRNPNEARRLLKSASEAQYPRAKIDVVQMDLEEGNVTGADLRSTVESMIRGMTPPKEVR